jgi:sporulation protein YlmC with PRC-barrel domain
MSIEVSNHTRSETMTRLLACTAVGLFLGLTPALAQTDSPMDKSQTPPAMQQQQPTEPPAVKPVEPAEPAAPSPGQSSEAMPPASPHQAAAAPTEESPQFLAKQESDDWLASNLIGKSVVNAENDRIGDVNDLVTDKDGKIVAVLIGAGGFLGLGEKHVAIRFEDVKLSRDEDNNVQVMVNISKDTLASAPDYQTLEEQKVSVSQGGGTAQ